MCIIAWRVSGSWNHEGKGGFHVGPDRRNASSDSEIFLHNPITDFVASVTRSAFSCFRPKAAKLQSTPYPTSFLLSYTAKIGLILRDDTDRSTPHRFRPPPRVRKSRGDALPCGKAALLGRKAARRIEGGGPADFLPLDSGPSGPREALGDHSRTAPLISPCGRGYEALRAQRSRRSW